MVTPPKGGAGGVACSTVPAFDLGEADYILPPCDGRMPTDFMGAAMSVRGDGGAGRRGRARSHAFDESAVGIPSATTAAGLDSGIAASAAPRREFGVLPPEVLQYSHACVAYHTSEGYEGARKVLGEIATNPKHSRVWSAMYFLASSVHEEDRLFGHKLLMRFKAEEFLVAVNLYEAKGLSRDSSEACEVIGQGRYMLLRMAEDPSHPKCEAAIKILRESENTDDRLAVEKIMAERAAIELRAREMAAEQDAALDVRERQDREYKEYKEYMDACNLCLSGVSRKEKKNGRGKLYAIASNPLHSRSRHALFFLSTSRIPEEQALAAAVLK